ncbi:hydroxymethylbilane synthase [Natranaerovirga hydrolytica]|uniref:Porphobilinogen deaminase n=1 Tax=Natranaerovirga hydrolytica TaxID=680378 RepID=A0A4R1MKB5_9FIRM|nr:hydroxymethylbilane synthase [Natranaerovirga hydrolytica]TCK92470.1 hydroxymethylbilane synthase [Natranaerovirga hydrolytica]
MKLVVGSRGSQLALSQTQWVIEKMKTCTPNLEIQIKVIKTKGDRIQNVSLNQIGGRGVFVKEIEKALIEDEIDFAVHSMKDMPSDNPKELIFAPSPIREDPRDVLITKHCIKELNQLPQGAKIGTGSKRRKFQLLDYREDFQVVDIRGNIDSRIKKMFDNNLDGIVLAAAGLKRLNILEHKEYTNIPLPVETFIPSPTQGILGIQMKKENIALYHLFQKMADEETNIQAKVERDFLKALNGSCHVPIGAYCKLDKNQLELLGVFGDEAGHTLVKKSLKGDIKDVGNIGKTLAKSLLQEVD